MGDSWKWRVRCYWADNVEPPKVPRRLSHETIHKTDASKDFEVEALQKNPDIGRIVVTNMREGI